MFWTGVQHELESDEDLLDDCAVYCSLFLIGFVLMCSLMYRLGNVLVVMTLVLICSGNLFAFISVDDASWGGVGWGWAGTYTHLTGARRGKLLG